MFYMAIRIFLISVTLCISFQLNAQGGVFEIARKGCVEDISYVIKNHPDAINAINNSGFTPLIISCYNDNLEVAKYLAEKVDNINYCSSVGTALMAAVYKKNIPITKMLLDLKADVNIPDQGGTTALHYAVRLKNEDLVKLLLEHGANAHKNDNNGFSPWDYANQDTNKSILEILKK